MSKRVHARIPARVADPPASLIGASNGRARGSHCRYGCHVEYSTARRRARARASAAATAAFRFRASAVCADTGLAIARRLRRCSKRARAATASGCVHSRPAGTISMQSTGQGATQSSQPLQSDASTPCIRFGAPTIASTGHAWMHSVQPMHVRSSMRAICRGPGSPRDVSSGGGASRPSNSASAAISVSPPGGQRSMSFVFAAMASAYGRHPSYPQRLHCVCGSRSSIRSARSGVPGMTVLF